MSSFFPVYNRSSDALNHKRLTSTLQSNQAKLNKIQEQISTGRRIGSPSEDPVAAMRAVRYQAALERNTQYGRNLDSNQAYLDASDSGIRSVSNLLTEIKSKLPELADATLTDNQKQATIAELNAIRDQLVSLANTKYNGRFLFAGSDTSLLPYSVVDGRVQFNGNLSKVEAPSSDAKLLQNNISGNDVFGGFSSSVQGIAKLQPYLTATTKLADLRGGSGIQSGSIEISDGYSTSIIDLSSADTLGDVVRMIEAAPPAGRELSVEIKNDRLELRFTDGGSPQLNIRESSGGTTAADLGIRGDLASLNGSTVVGQGLSPVLALNTHLSQVTGAPAVAYLTSPGEANDIVFRAKTNGSENNGLNIQYVNSENLQAGSGIIQGSEEVYFLSTPRAAQAGLSFSGVGNDIVLTGVGSGSYLNQVEIEIYDAGAIGNNAVTSYDASTGVYSIGVDSSNGTTAQAVIDAINAQGTFKAAADTSDPANGAFNPGATINTADAGVVRSNTGNSGGEANTVYVHVNPDKTNAYHVLAALNKNTDLIDVYDIEIDTTDGLNVEGPGKAIVDADALAVTGGGSGSDFDGAPGIEVRINGVRYRISMENVETIEDMINEVESKVPGMYVQINAAGDGLNIGVRQAGVSFTVGENGGQSATQLGIRTLNPETRLAALNNGLGVGTRNGADFIINRNDGTSIEIDVSSAETIQDVMNLINEHPDNQDPATQVTAAMAQYGNAITLLDDNPTGSMPVNVEVVAGSNAAVDLGLVKVGELIGYPTNVPAPTQASADIYFAGPTGVNRSFRVIANEPGAEYNNIEVEVVAGATGDNATATYDPLNQKLYLQVDPAATTTNTAIEAIQQTGFFRGELINNDYEAYNSGSGIMSDLGVIGTLGGGSATPSAQPSKATVKGTPPNQYNTALDIVANQAGTAYGFTKIFFVAGASGDSASATYDSVAKSLTVVVDPSATTSNTIAAAINAEGTFSASLNTNVDPTNDGTGVFGANWQVGTTNQGAPGTYKGRDVNPQENPSIFNTIDRLISALGDSSEFGRIELARAAELLEQDIDRVDAAIADVGFRSQYNDFLIFQNEDLNLDLQESLSNEVDVDLVQAISELTAQQAAVEASMRMLSQTFNTTLLDYL